MKTASIFSTNNHVAFITEFSEKDCAQNICQIDPGRFVIVSHILNKSFYEPKVIL